jgi:hypothetical protein
MDLELNKIYLVQLEKNNARNAVFIGRKYSKKTLSNYCFLVKAKNRPFTVYSCSRPLDINENPIKIYNSKHRKTTQYEREYFREKFGTEI